MPSIRNGVKLRSSTKRNTMRSIEGKYCFDVATFYPVVMSIATRCRGVEVSARLQLRHTMSSRVVRSQVKKEKKKRKKEKRKSAQLDVSMKSDDGADDDVDEPAKKSKKKQKRKSSEMNGACIEKPTSAKKMKKKGKQSVGEE